MFYFKLSKIRKLTKFLVSLDFESINKYNINEITEDLEIQKILSFSKDLEDLMRYVENVDKNLIYEENNFKLNDNSKFDEVLFKIKSLKNKFINMNEKLEKELIEVKKVHSDENWIKSQFASVFSKLQGVNSIDDFGNILLNQIAKAIGAQVGLFYVKSAETEDDSLYNLNNFFGIPANIVSPRLVKGEGLIGQSILEKNIKIINSGNGFDFSFDNIEYGFGKVQLNQILIIPIFYQNKLYSVLEFATVNKFSEFHIEYLNQITESIGLSIKNILNNMLTEKLLIEIKESNKSLASQKQALDSSAIVAETDLRGRITYVNQKFIEISKYSREELIGQDHRILNSRYHDKSFFIDLWRTISRGEVWHGEVKNRSKNGEYYWVDTTIYPIKNAFDKIIKYIAIRFDITDKKRMLEELQEATKTANIAAKTKTDFLANMSHEIRTPMNAIIAMTDVLSETELTTDQDKYVKVINNAGSILLDVINSILDLSKIEAGQLNLEKIEYNLYDMLNSAIAVMNSSAIKKNLALVVDIEANVPENIFGDPSRLRQVIINLLANAIKFTNKGEIVLKVKIDRESCNNLFFSVSDTGIGIAFENYSKIFSVFSQANTSTSREYGGTGLGLSISKKLVESFGGKINFISELGKGSNFYFTLPHNITTFTPESYATEFPHKRITFLELNESLIKIYKNLFIELKLDYSFVSRFEEIINLQKQLPSEYIFIDIKNDYFQISNFLKEFNEISENQIAKIYFLIDKEMPKIDVSMYKNIQINYIAKPIYQKKIINLLQNTKVENKKVVDNNSGVIPLSKYKKKFKILVVDDVLENIEIIKIYLSAFSFDVDFAMNGNDAIKKFKLNKYDIIFMDIQMPFMDGNETMRNIRQIEQNLNLPHTQIIMLSAHATTDEMENSKKSGCDGYLTKPIKKKTFIETMEVFCNKLSS